MSDFGLAQRLEISRAEAKEITTAYFARFPDVSAYIERTIEEGRRNGYVSTILGRRRYMPGLISGNYMLRAAAEREATNAPLQGSAADLMKLAMVQIDRALRRIGTRCDDAPANPRRADLRSAQAALAEVASLVREHMEQAIELIGSARSDAQSRTQLVRRRADRRESHSNVFRAVRWAIRALLAARCRRLSCTRRVRTSRWRSRAPTPQREQGLMDRTYVPEHTGMIFVFDGDAPVEFWMKDTLVPLDMIFVAADGTVRRVYANVPVVARRRRRRRHPARERTGEVCHRASRGRGRT